MGAGPCAVRTCGKPVYAKGLCDPHYRRKRRTGDVQAHRPIGENVSRTCSAPTCLRLAVERGWCHAHYLRLVRLGDVLAERPIGRRMNTVCQVETCERPATGRGLCKTHADRKRKYGNVQAEKPIRVIAGTGYISHGYRHVPVPKSLRHLTNGETPYPEHRLVMAQLLGRPLLPEESVHHKNGDRICNDPSNLELWSRWQPSGARVTDKLDWARSFMRRYAPQELKENLLF